MGGTSTSEQQQTQQQVSDPWGPAKPLLGGILNQLQGALPNTGLTGAENTALTGLAGNTGYLSQFGPAATGLASNLLAGGPDRTGMVGDAYTNYTKSLAPTASGQYLDPSTNPFYSQLTQNIGSDVQDRLSAMYAGAGRAPVGAGSYGGNLAEGIASGIAPVAAQLYGQERGRQMDAITGMYGAGGQTAGLLSGLDQTRFGNQLQGIGAAQAAQGIQTDPFNQALQVEAMRRGIPLANLQQIAGLGIPIAGLGGQVSGTSATTGSKTLSPIEQFYMLASGTGSLFSGGKKG